MYVLTNISLLRLYGSTHDLSMILYLLDCGSYISKRGQASRRIINQKCAEGNKKTLNTMRDPLRWCEVRLGLWLIGGFWYIKNPKLLISDIVTDWSTVQLYALFFLWTRSPHVPFSKSRRLIGFIWHTKFIGRKNNSISCLQVKLKEIPSHFKLRILKCQKCVN